MSAVPDEPRDERAYRPCVGAMVLNREGCVFVARRNDVSDTGHAWQMPQGGIDADEDPEAAARRELYEETGISSVVLEDRTDGWLYYDLPDAYLGRWAGRYRGQRQMWFVYRFVGDEAEIDLQHHESPEFDAWQWVPVETLPDLVVPFKRPVYEDLVRTFASRARPSA